MPLLAMSLEREFPKTRLSRESRRRGSLTSLRTQTSVIWLLIWEWVCTGPTSSLQTQESTQRRTIVSPVLSTTRLSSLEAKREEIDLSGTPLKSEEPIFKRLELVALLYLFLNSLRIWPRLSSSQLLRGLREFTMLNALKKLTKSVRMLRMLKSFSISTRRKRSLGNWEYP